MKLPKILEVTLRDGSYMIDFKFTASDTALLCAELERVGFSMIEIGHGVGLGASREGKGQASETDENYMKSAQESLSHAAWGMFCIPGIASLDDIDLAAQYKMNFIRIGTNVTEAEMAERYIERAKKHGMMVCANFMKSYAMPHDEFAEKAALVQKYGADVLYIVDSAGGMLTSEMEKYIASVQDKCDISLGFHGHNNLELGVANTLRAIEMGVDIVDSSLQGMGRGGGNVATEILLLLLQRIGVPLDINPLEVMDLGEKYIKPLIEKHGYNAIDMVSGFAQFHSSYMGVINEFSGRYGVDPRELIIEVCKVDMVNAPREMVDKIAQRLSKVSKKNMFTAQFRFDRYFGNEQ